MALLLLSPSKVSFSPRYINGSHKNIRACHFFRVKSFKFVMRNNERAPSPLPRHSRVIQSAEKMTRTNGPEISQNLTGQMYLKYSPPLIGKFIPR